MIDPKKIDEIVSQIAGKFNPDKIILFGSYAVGNQTEDSDIDLIVVKDSDLPKHKRSFDIQKSFIGSMIPMDILVYTNYEFEKEKIEKHSFINKALKTSKLMYERR